MDVETDVTILDLSFHRKGAAGRATPRRRGTSTELF